MLKDSRIATTLFDGVSPNPVEADVDKGIARYREASCDFILAVGGGSSLDVGKAIRLRTSNNLPLEEYDALKGGSEKISGNMPRMISIPTTAGTGSEVGRSTVITPRATGRKTVIFSPHLIPDVAICDPRLTVNLPPKLTAATGMDALTHNIESYLSTNYHPICDAIALEGVRIAAENIGGAVEHGRDIEARSAMMMAAVMGAIAFQKDLGVAHSLAHPLSTVAGLHHGLANAVMLPHAMRFNLQYAAGRLKDVAARLGVNVSGLSDTAAADKGIQRVRELIREIGIPARLSDAGVREEQIPAMAGQAILDGCHLTNPRPCTKGDMVALYKAAF
jgi:alcohol dehydrogenase class IV